jgi:hypothetical protein
MWNQVKKLTTVTSREVKAVHPVMRIRRIIKRRLASSVVIGFAFGCGILESS